MKVLMFKMINELIILLLLFYSGTCLGFSPWHVDGGLTYTSFEQQVKTKIGGGGADPLVQESSLGLLFHGGYQFSEIFSTGLFIQMDSGTRKASQYTGLDSNGQVQVTTPTGGSFSELWLGPYIRYSSGLFFAQLTYAIVGQRKDSARSDLPSKSGSTSEDFKTSTSVAWAVSLGSIVPINQIYALMISMQYRVRYYDKRGSENLINDVVHGTQSINPFVGIKTSF
jgi:hypothetical protein